VDLAFTSASGVCPTITRGSRDVVGVTYPSASDGRPCRFVTVQQTREHLTFNCVTFSIVTTTTRVNSTAF
jgi:hypothetical protein